MLLVIYASFSIIFISFTKIGGNIAKPIMQKFKYFDESGESVLIPRRLHLS